MLLGWSNATGVIPARVAETQVLVGKRSRKHTSEIDGILGEHGELNQSKVLQEPPMVRNAFPPEGKNLNI